MSGDSKAQFEKRTHHAKRVRRGIWCFGITVAAAFFAYLTWPWLLDGERTEVPEGVISAWENAGADFGWMGEDRLGKLTFRLEGEEGDVPAFRMQISPKEGWGTLPPVRCRFAVNQESWLDGGDVRAMSRLKYLRKLRLGDFILLTDARLNELASLDRLESLDLNWVSASDVTDAGWAKLKALQRLRALRVHTYGHVMTDTGVQALASLRSLQRLYLECPNPVSAAGLRMLASLPNLQSLHVAVDGRAVVGTSLHALASHGSLQCLELCLTEATADDLQRLNVLGRCATLHLDLGPCEVTDSILTRAASLGNLRYVRFNLGGSTVTTSGLNALASNQAIESIALSCYQAADADLGKLMALSRIRRLGLNLRCANVTEPRLKELNRLGGIRSLELSHTRVTDASLAQLGHLSNLEDLNLFATNITGTGLAELSRCTALRSLDLGRTEVTDAGLKALSSLTNLRSLSLWETKVTDACVKELACLKRLERLDLGRTQFTEQGVEDLQRALPKVQIRSPSRRQRIRGIDY